MKLISSLIGVFFLVSLSTDAISSSDDFRVYYDHGNPKVILSNNGIRSESSLNEYGKSICSKNKFCVLWFYSKKENASLGKKAMESGDLFAVTPGLYGIFSKNKVNNHVICYEPKSGC